MTALLASLITVLSVPYFIGGVSMPRWWLMALTVVLPWGQVRPQVAICLAGLWISACLSLIQTPLWQTGALDCFFLTLTLLFCLVGASFSNIDFVMKCVCVGASASSMIALDQWFRGSAPVGLFGNSEVLAEFMAPLFVWAFWKRRWLCALGTSIPVMLCHSRIAAAAVIVGMIFALPRGKTVWPKVVLVSLMLAGAAIVMTYGEISKFWSAMDRVLLWRVGYESITGLGHGLGWWAYTHPYPMQEFVHSDVLQSAAELGVGCVFLILLPVFVLLGSKKHAAERAAFVVLCFEAIVSFPLHLAAPSMVFALLAGFLARDDNALYYFGFSRRVESQVHA